MLLSNALIYVKADSFTNTSHEAIKKRYQKGKELFKKNDGSIKPEHPTETLD